jgi:GTP:adenosylcobinamide-phosphate guanylyltransferase
VEVPAVVAAGEGRASKAIHGESKVYLEIEGRSLVAQVVATLQRVPEVSEIWVVGNAPRLEKVFGDPSLRGELRVPVTIVPQFRNLYENAWQTYRRLLPAAGPEGRDPAPEDAERPVLFLSADLPFATPQEISEFIRRGAALDCDYALGLVTETSMRPFRRTAAGDPGIEMAYFNLREGRFRQSNLHLVKPAHVGNRRYIEEMYEHRYQKEIGNIISLAWRIFWREGGGLRVLGYYAVIHAAAVADRWGWLRLADLLRGWIGISRVEEAVGRLLQTRFRFVTTEVGGCAVDIDNEEHYETAKLRYREWRRSQEETAERLHGPLTLPAVASGREQTEVRVLPAQVRPPST